MKNKLFFFGFIVAILFLVAIKINLIATTYYNIDYFIYSFISNKWIQGDSTYLSAMFPPLNSWIQYAIQFLYTAKTIDSLIVISNIVGFSFSLGSLFLVYKFAKIQGLSKFNTVMNVLLVATVPYVFFQSSFGDTGNIYAFFITLLFYLRFTIGYDNIVGKGLILLSLGGLLLSRKESFIIVVFFFFFEILFSRKKKEVIYLGILFSLVILAPIILFFHRFTGHFYYVEVETMIKGMLGISVVSYSDIHINMLKSFVQDSSITGARAWFLNSSSQSGYIFNTFVFTISSIVAVFGFGGFIKEFQKNTKNNTYFLAPIFIILGILAIYFYLGKNTFQGALYDIKTFFYIDGFQSFQRYFMPFLYLFSFGLIFYIKYHNDGLRRGVVCLGIVLNLVTIYFDYSSKWQFADYDNYENPIGIYGGLSINTGYTTKGEVELYKFLRKTDLMGNIFNITWRNDNAQIINRAYLVGKSKIGLVMFFNEGTILPGNNKNGLTKITKSGYYYIKDNFSDLLLIHPSKNNLLTANKKVTEKGDVKFIQIDTSISKPNELFKNLKVKKIFSYDTIELYELLQ